MKSLRWSFPASFIPFFLAAVAIMSFQCGIESDCPLCSSILAEGIAVSVPAVNRNDFWTVGRCRQQIEVKTLCVLHHLRPAEWFKTGCWSPCCSMNTTTFG